jgi:hypothetical protein
MELWTCFGTGLLAAGGKSGRAAHAGDPRFLASDPAAQLLKSPRAQALLPAAGLLTREAWQAGTLFTQAERIRVPGNCALTSRGELRGGSPGLLQAWEDPGRLTASRLPFLLLTLGKWL